MKSYKALMNSLADDPGLRQLTDEEVAKLRATFLEAFDDLAACCDKHHLTLVLIGGSAIGAVRHKGFIPWDDDMDVAMPRDDYEKLKQVFDEELGEKYILAAPNYRNNARYRLPMMLIKDTLLVDIGGNPQDEGAKIKIDIFVIENIPDNPVIRLAKGFRCTALMAIGGYMETYEHQSEAFKRFMCKTEEGERAFRRRIRMGRLFSFLSFQQWMNIIDRACQYKKQTSLMGIPSGRGHYFGETRPRKTFIPVSQGEFEGRRVNLPGDPDDYISHLYGKDYMTLPPVEKRERHFLVDIKFKGD